MAAEGVLVGLAAIVVLGIAAQWIAWRLNLPSILVLLIFGFIAGPVTGFMDPDALLGDILLPFVALAVAVILFEGGLSLKLSDIRGHGRVVANLISGGLVVTWGLGTVLLHYLTGLTWGLSILLGAVFVVTGPTVIGPLVRHVRPSGRVGPIVKWEGILNDPVGAVLAVLVFEAIVAGALADAATVIVGGVLRSLVLGSLVGLAGAALLVLLIVRRWVPDYLEVPTTLAVVVAVYAVADVIQPESGLLSVTLMGVALANQNLATVKHIYTFKENLTILLIAVLFILLAARLDPADLATLGWGSLAFLAALILLVRPLAVLVSTWGSVLSWKERTFIAAMAPRGIVAAAVAAFFALRLEEIGHPQADRLVPITFLVIIGTVAVYGLAARPVARVLGLAASEPQGVFLVDADPFARAVGRALRDHGYRVVLADTNAANVDAAIEDGLEAKHVNVLAEEVHEELELSTVGRLLALTPNDEVNALACFHFIDTFGKDEVYQLPPHERPDEGRKSVGWHLRGRPLFRTGVTHDGLLARVEAGDVIGTVSSDVPMRELASGTGGPAIPLFVVEPPAPKALGGNNGSRSRGPGRLRIVVADEKRPLRNGERLVYLGAPHPRQDEGSTGATR